MYSINFPDGLNESTFLAQYWQQKPLYMPAAWPGFENPLGPDELAGLALDADFHSRIVQQHAPDRWSLRQGPFTADDFAALDGESWSLLVSDIEKHLPELKRYVSPFRFIPDWRFDDFMISYAPPGGSVGPHMDDYDVFLIQAEGRRDWKLEGDFRSLPMPEEDLLPDTELRLIKNFNTVRTISCEVGDILYLPPRLGHFGVAVSECMTWSMGFKAPSFQDMLMHYLDDFQALSEHKRYIDKGLNTQVYPGEITSGQLQQLKSWFIQQIKTDDETFVRWVAAYLSGDAPFGEPAEMAETLKFKDTKNHSFVTNPFVRFNFIKFGAKARLYAGGEEFDVSMALAKTLTAKSRINLPEVSELDKEPVMKMLKKGCLLETLP